MVTIEDIISRYREYLLSFSRRNFFKLNYYGAGYTSQDFYQEIMLNLVTAKNRHPNLQIDFGFIHGVANNTLKQMLYKYSREKRAIKPHQRISIDFNTEICDNTIDFERALFLRKLMESIKAQVVNPLYLELLSALEADVEINEYLSENYKLSKGKIKGIKNRFKKEIKRLNLGVL